MHSLIAVLLSLNVVPALAEPRTITADIWTDNWFEMWVNGTKVIEDSVPITTERSFNAETVRFTVELPMIVAIKAMDFKENDSGLEYIGSRRQQMGDGGLIAQFVDAETGESVAVTDSSMRCLVVHHAPIDRSCESSSNPVAGEGACAFEMADEPEGWTDPGFDASDWPQATQHTAGAVDPNGGYDAVRWSETARFVWGPDLERDNTVLCRAAID
ncbi:PEBP family protein [Roseobacter sinensis]|uniref:PEBP family protein n=1 Tax=Roseobacter sinensis TaxID=2931391 RepID=A0ABT3BHM8_9RHOB|nr:PEBP family protein [Roseobacter sp. WL0113]MCV3273079.1 PEBP family protein [Roseobacter sp. WL0113]